MKKMMIALAGIVSVMMLASCQKEVEIDGDVSLEKRGSDYRLEVSGTAVRKYEVYNDSTKKWEYQGASTDKKAVCNTASISWDDEKNTNEKKYEFSVDYKGEALDNKTTEPLWFDGMLIEYKGKYRFEAYSKEKNPDPIDVTVTGSPRDKKFTVKGSVVTWQNSDNPEEKEQRGRVEFELTFTR